MTKFQFDPLTPNLSNEQKWEQIKLWRNSQLAQTDWTMHTDAPTDKAAWAAYRQLLRDLPAQGGKAEDAEFPIKP
jgi:hypothetical protein